MKLPINYKKAHWSVRREARLQYQSEQKGLCCHCGARFDEGPADHIEKKKLNMRLFPKKFLSHPIHLHHCHKTEMTIGAVHARCNAVLWQYHGE